MAKSLDLEEQEQLDQIKHFWKQYGNAITWALIVILTGVASWNFYQYWQRNQAVQAASMYDEVERASSAGDLAKLERVFTDTKDRFGSTTYAQQAGLLAAKQFFEAGKMDEAKAALTWVADKTSDPGYQAIAKLRLAGLLVDEGAYDQSLDLLQWQFPAQFQGLAADRRGDVLRLQGKTKEAMAAYVQAFKQLDERADYRRLVEVKLNSLGVDPAATTEAPVKEEGAK